MNTLPTQFTTTLTLEEMEALIRRVVREAVHEEFERVLRRLPLAIGEDWSHEGPDDSEGDRVLLAEALAERERYRTDRTGWQSWDEFKAELKAAEAAGELPD
ncbi:MAG: hypothetical protein NZM42_11205 [Gemmatales bacterium]|nr:hypothetical protein [Gemmatales bacterium]MCX7853904.1 hypothetical protein [Caldilineales bacterium]